MIAIQPAPPLSNGSSHAVPTANLNARLEAATEALLKTRDQVVAALDQHLRELDMLRQAIGNSDKPLLSLVPSPVASPPPPVVAAQLAPAVPAERPVPPSPMPLMTQVLWPSKAFEEAAPAPAPARPSKPSSPLVAYSSMHSSVDLNMSVAPDLEKATLEELNAALAYAFSHVSNARTPSQAPSPSKPWSGRDNGLDGSH